MLSYFQIKLYLQGSDWLASKLLNNLLKGFYLLHKFSFKSLTKTHICRVRCLNNENQDHVIDGFEREFANS